MIQALEILAALLGLIQGVLVMFNKRANWIFYCLQMVALLLFSYMSGLYGDVINDALYLVLGIVAYILWNNGAAKVISVSSFRAIASYCLLTIAVTIILAMHLKSTDDPLPLLDAVSTTTSLLATILMVMRRVDCWVVWLFNDILYCAEYYMLPNQAIYLLLLNVLWSVMAVISYIEWRRILKAQYQ